MKRLTKITMKTFHYMITLISLLFVFGKNISAQSCFLPDEYRHVVAVTGETITLGKADPQNGRTVCYKWDNSPYIVSGSDLNSPTVQIQTPNEPCTLSFTVKMIGQYVSTCAITVEVYQDFTIESIAAKHFCWNEGDNISIDEFIIITNPANMSRFVHLKDDSKVASCSWLDGFDEFGCTQTLTFQAISNQSVVDEESIDIEVATDVVSLDVDVETGDKVSDAALDLVRKIKSADALIDNINNRAKLIEQFLKNKFPQSPFEFEYEPITLYGKINNKVNNCCDGDYVTWNHELQVGGSVGIGGTAYFPVRSFHPCLLTLPPQLNVQVDLMLSLTTEGVYQFSECRNNPITLNLMGDFNAAGGVAWNKEENWLYGFIGVFVVPSISASWQVVPMKLPNLKFSMDLGAKITGKMTTTWFKGDFTKTVILCRLPK